MSSWPFANPSSGGDAWLERAGVAGIPVGSALTIGRSHTNALVLDTEGVSRCHAVIHSQKSGEYWLADLGSRNGTWLNEQRILQPARLKNGDKITIVGNDFTFCLREFDEEPEPTGTMQTMQLQETREYPFWLLIADIENFVGLSQALSGPNLAAHVGTWLHDCKDVVEAEKGRINKYLGDGFLAVWPDIDGLEQRVFRSIQGLAAISELGKPSFRIVVHRGIVSVGGSPLLAEESFVGREVNFTFRMEKLAGSLRLAQLFSETAAAKLSPLMPLRQLPAQRLKGFEAPFNFFSPVEKPAR